jgi:hypothetical protein
MIKMPWMIEPAIDDHGQARACRAIINNSAGQARN